MSVIKDNEKVLGIQVRGKLGRPDLPDVYGVGGIYQMRPRKGGPIQVKMRYYAPTGSPGPGQLLQRQKMRELVALWHGLTYEQKFSYRYTGKRKGMTAFNWYLHLNLPTYVPSVATNFAMLQEDSGLILLQMGGIILIEFSLILLEDGAFLLTENRDKLV